MDDSNYFRAKATYNAGVEDMKNYVRVVIIICITYVLGICIFAGVTKKYFDSFTKNDIDVVRLNDIKKTAEENWESLQELDSRDFGADFVVLDNANNVLYSSCATEGDRLTIEEAIKKRYPYAYVVRNNRIVGNVILIDFGEDIYIHMRRKILLGFGICELVIFLGALFWGLYIYKNIVVPFKKMEDFAGKVAEGKLDEPLLMEKNNMFGVFSESFDIMREELAESRRRENALQRKEKELVASLSHDLKTPITGIKLSAELLKAKLTVQEAGQGQLEQIADNIYKKAEQIDLLVSDLFSYTLDDLSEFKVRCQDEESGVLSDIIRKNDDRGWVTQAALPNVLIHVDVKRLNQVIGNIIANSVKYADTRMDVNYRIIKGYLEMEIRDYGPGVPKEELPLITNKFYRGKRANDDEKEGSGLGLYISKMLMEKMNGEMLCESEGEGLAVILLIPLS